jgi:hypothetical protein
VLKVQTAEIVATNDWPVCVCCAVQERFTSKLRSHEVVGIITGTYESSKEAVLCILAVFTSEEAVFMHPHSRQKHLENRPRLSYLATWLYPLRATPLNDQCGFTLRFPRCTGIHDKSWKEAATLADVCEMRIHGAGSIPSEVNFN